MAKLLFQESGLQFEFTADWIVFKYDAHRFYLYLSGAGLKGVDFIAIREEELILIEVKNYRERIEKENYKPIQVLLEKPEYYVEKFSRKFEDTFRLLKIIDQYYLRKWWYQAIFQRFKSYFPKREVLKTEVGFWSKANELLRQSNKVKLILWIEAEPKAIRSELLHFQSAIQDNFPDDMRFQLAHQENPVKGIDVNLLSSENL